MSTINHAIFTKYINSFFTLEIPRFLIVFLMEDKVDKVEKVIQNMPIDFITWAAYL